MHVDFIFYILIADTKGVQYMYGNGNSFNIPWYFFAGIVINGMTSIIHNGRFFLGL